MNYIRVVRGYFRGILLSSVFLTFIITVAMFSAVNVYSQIRYMVNDYYVIENNTLSNPYYVQYFHSFEDLAHQHDKIEEAFTQKIEELKKHQVVEDVFTIRSVNPLRYKDYRISILLYDPGLTEAFPSLLPSGVDFEDNPDGCILGSRIFNSVRSGEEIELTFYQAPTTTLSVPVIGHITSPYRYMTFNAGSTSPSASQLLTTGEIIIMQATENNIEQLSKLGTVQYNTNFILSFTADATEDEIEAVLGSLGEAAFPVPLKDVINRSRTNVQKLMRDTLPLPLCLLSAVTIAFLSNILLNVRKKERDLAVYYLCGCSRKMYACVAIGANCIISCIPCLLNAAFVFLAPHLDWMGVLMVDDVLYTPSSLLPIVWYFLFSCVLAICATILPMIKKSPVSYLRGVE